MRHQPFRFQRAERRAMDLDGNLFDVSVHGYDSIEFQADRDKKQQTAKA